MTTTLAANGFSIIGGKPTEAGSDEYRMVNPANYGQVTEPVFHCAKVDDINHALELSREAAADWRRRPAKDRANLIRGIRDRFEANRDPLVAQMMRDTGRSDTWYGGEFSRMLTNADLLIPVVQKGDWQQPAITTEHNIRKCWVPFENVAIWGPNNFLAAFGANSGNIFFSALGAGCMPISVSNMSAAPTDEMFAQLAAEEVAEQGFHRGTVSLLHINNQELAGKLAEHSLLSMVSYTGGGQFGRWLKGRAKGGDTHFVHELPGVFNPIWMFPEALSQEPEKLAKAYAAMLFDQNLFCTFANYSFAVADAASEKFIAELGELIEGREEMQLMLSKRTREKFEEGLAQVQQYGVEIRYKSQGDPARSRAEERFYLGVIRLDDFVKHYKELKELEVFGGLGIIVLVDKVEEFADVAVGLRKSLATAIWATRNEWQQHRGIIDPIYGSAGRIVGKVGAVPTGIPPCQAVHHSSDIPGLSGIGPDAIYELCEMKCFHGWDDSDLPSALQYDNPNKLLRTVDGALGKASG